MKASKQVILGSIDVDTDEGKIWVNAPNCVLRIQGLNFISEKDKFSMVDVSDGEVRMLNGDLSDLVSTDLTKLIQLIANQVSMFPGSEQDFIKFITDSISVYVFRNVSRKDRNDST